MNEDEQLRNAVKQRIRPKPNTTARLGETLSELMEVWIEPRQARFGPVVELWRRMVPAELQRHCKLSDISSGQLKVLVDSPSYANELRWCSSELLKEIQQHCPRANIKKIKVVLG